MRMSSVVAATLAMTAALARPAFAQTRAGKPDQPATAPANPLQQTHEKLAASLKLTDAKDKPGREALADFRRGRAAWLETNGPEIKRLQKQLGKYHQARDAKAAKAAKDAMARLGKLRAERTMLQRTLMGRLKKLLTAEQYAKADAGLNPASTRKAPPNRFHYLGQLGLTKKQLAQTKAIMENARKEAASAKGPMSPRNNPMGKAWAKIVTEVLTERDRVKLADLIRRASHRRMVMAMFGRVGLTGEQSAKIDAIWEAAYAKAKKEPKKKFEIYSAAQGEAIEKVLTPEQRKKLPRRNRGMMPRRPTSAPARPTGKGHFPEKHTD